MIQYPHVMWLVNTLEAIFHHPTDISSNNLTIHRIDWKHSTKPKVSVSLAQFLHSQMLKYLRPVQSCWTGEDIGQNGMRQGASLIATKISYFCKFYKILQKHILM
jgi:poly(3-hydroxyalkanoate) synthetase